MRILVTNDDGLDATGIEVLEDIARELSDDVWVIAPAQDNSGASHSLTLHEPLRHSHHGEQKFSIHGTPTDCVIMGVRKFLGDTPPDLVLSGINHGQNIADDVTYSGTIAGAFEGAILGIPSIALSLATGIKTPNSVHWDTPKEHAVSLITQLLDGGIDADIPLNINFPDCGPSDVKGKLITVQGKRDPGLLRIDTRQDPRGRDYFWFDFERRLSKPAKGTDLWAVYNDYISITPLHLNMTHHESCHALAQKFNDI